MTFIRFFLLLAALTFSLAAVNMADARNSTPRGYLKPVTKMLGNNSETAQKNARNYAQKNAKNFAEKNFRKRDRKRDWNPDRRHRGKKAKTANSGVNE